MHLYCTKKRQYKLYNCQELFMLTQLCVCACVYVPFPDLCHWVSGVSWYFRPGAGRDASVWCAD